MTDAPRRAFVTVSGRQVHYRVAGDGPPVVLLHPTPLSSKVFLPLMAQLSGTHRVYALDRPGYGSSEAAATADPSVADYADLLDEGLDALGLDNPAVLGRSTGACVALELARRHPGRARRLVLDLLPVWESQAEAELFALRYAADITPDWAGTHLLTAWMMERSDHLFWPWFRQSRAARRVVDVPPPDFVHGQVMHLLEAGSAYATGFHAAWGYDPLPGLAELGATGLPISVIAREGTSRSHQLDRIGSAGTSVTVSTVAGDEIAYLGHLAGLLRDDGGSPGEPVAGTTPAAAEGHPAAQSVRRRFIDLPGQQVSVWERTAGEARPVLLLPELPRSGSSLRPVLDRLHGPALSLDLPGLGDTAARTATESVESLASWAVAVLDAQGWASSVDVYGRGFGALVAAAVAAHHPERVHGLVLDAPVETDDSVDFFPDLTPRWDGTHLLTAWNRVRDAALFEPWFERRATNVRDDEVPGPDGLHATLVDLLRSPDHAEALYRAGFGRRFKEFVPASGIPTVVVGRHTVGGTVTLPAGTDPVAALARTRTGEPAT